MIRIDLRKSIARHIINLRKEKANILLHLGLTDVNSEWGRELIREYQGKAHMIDVMRQTGRLCAKP